MVPRTGAPADGAGRGRDRLGAALAFGFIALLLSTEVVLTLPDVTDSASFVATFYAGHRALIVILQILGFVAAALFAGYAWRLRWVDRVVGGAGLVTAVCALVPGAVTLVIAVVADPALPASAGRWNRLEPRADDVLFVGVFLFAVGCHGSAGPQASGARRSGRSRGAVVPGSLDPGGDGNASWCARIGGTAVVHRAGGHDGSSEPARDPASRCASAAGGPSVIAPKPLAAEPPEHICVDGGATRWPGMRHHQGGAGRCHVSDRKSATSRPNVREVMVPPCPALGYTMSRPC